MTMSTDPLAVAYHKAEHVVAMVACGMRFKRVEITPWGRVLQFAWPPCPKSVETTGAILQEQNVSVVVRLRSQRRFDPRAPDTESHEAR